MSWVVHSAEPALTARERQVLELVAGGYSAKEAAGQIGIAPRTVERYIEKVRLKMRAKNRAHMVTQAVLAGYLKIGSGTEAKSLWEGQREICADRPTLHAVGD
jgi:LuxR family transcriptional regulator, transcriptional regulator of spore coat protein